MTQAFVEQSIAIRGIKLAYKLWRADKPKKVLALHGWLDNAASFDYLAEQLSDYCVLALDFAGQGFSEHRPASASYHLWDDTLDVCLLLEQLGWQEFVLIGHSRGAMVANMLAATQLKDKVSQLILIDALMPIPVEAEQAAEQLQRFLEDGLKQRKIRYFDSREQAIAVRAKASNFPSELAEVLASRQIRQSEHGWYWRLDERLKNASALKLNEQHNQAFLQALTCPVDVFVAKQGMGRLAIMDKAAKQFPLFRWHFVDAIHHFHMTADAVEIVQCLE